MNGSEKGFHTDELQSSSEADAGRVTKSETQWVITLDGLLKGMARGLDESHAVTRLERNKSDR